jgi:hypothetical protein
MDKKDSEEEANREVRESVKEIGVQKCETRHKSLGAGEEVREKSSPE